MSKSNSDQSSEKIRFIPFGGLGDIGKNMMSLEFRGSILIIDCGIKFPDDDMFGIDLVIPDFSYILENKDKIAGIVVTHGHEDHIGAFPYLLDKIKNVPIYSSRLCIELIKSRFDDHKLKEKDYDFKTIEPRQEITIGEFKVEFIQVNHSIADSYALAITTDIGTIVHSGDFKIDHKPIDDKKFDFYRLSSLGEKEILLLMSDSTNVERDGFSPSESLLENKFREAITNNKGRTIIATFSSNIHRIQQVIDVAVELGKKVALSGRSMEKVVNLSLQSGYLRIPMGILININEINDLPRDKVIVITTGTQGEPMSALSLLARESHRWIDLKSDDTVILSSSVIPGNEKTVSKIINTLFKTGATIIYKNFGDIHVTGHGHKEDLKMMLSLIRPKYFIPIHGEFRHLVHHASLAEEMGVSGSDIIVAQEGDIIDISQDKIEKVDSLDLQLIMVDGKGVGDIGGLVLRDRQRLSENGIVVVIIAINEYGLVNKPEIISRGFVYIKENAEMLDKSELIVEKIIDDEFNKESEIDYNVIKNKVKSKLRTYFFSKVERKPMLIVRIIEC